MKSVKVNFIYNVLYQILVLILPLITVPYVSRILGADGVGVYSYTYSIVYYFVLMSMLGINNYGNRSIAKVRDNKEELSKTFTGIYTIQLFMSSLMMVLYLSYVLLFNNEYKVIALIQSVNLISATLDINWFFFGMEKFKLTVTRNTIIKLLSLIGIFTFVKTSNDIWIYTIILVSSTLISNIILIPFLLKEVQFVKLKFTDIKKHIKLILILFIPLIAVSLYKVMDKIMLGKLCDISEVGYYEQTEKIINIPMGIVTALGTVMLPRISSLVSKGDETTIRNYIDKSIKFMMFLAFPICFGLMAVSSNFIPLFLGDDFIKSSILIYFLAPTIIFISFANVIRTQYLIPKEKDKVYIISVVSGAIINLTMNFILISKLQSIGACIGTIAAEIFVMAYQTISVRKELPTKKYLISTLTYLIKALIMFVIVYLFNYLEIGNVIRLLIQITIGCIVYGLLNIKYILSLVDIKAILRKIKKA